MIYSIKILNSLLKNSFLQYQTVRWHDYRILTLEYRACADNAVFSKKYSLIYNKGAKYCKGHNAYIAIVREKNKKKKCDFF